MAADPGTGKPTTFEDLQAWFAQRPEQPDGADPDDVHQHWKSFIEDAARSGRVRSISNADCCRVFQRLLGNAADLGGDAYPQNAWTPDGDHAEEYRRADAANRLSAAWAILFSLRSGPRKSPAALDGDASRRRFVPQFLRPPNHIHDVDIFDVYARRGGPADGIALVSGPRGCGKSQLLSDLASSARAGPQRTEGIGLQLKGGYLPLVVPSMDIGMAEDDAKRLTRDVIEEICIHAIRHVQRVVPERTAPTAGSLLGHTVNKALLRFGHDLLLLARWCGVNLALFRLFTLLMLFVLGSAMVLLKAPGVSWGATMQGASDFDSALGLGPLVGHFAGFLLGLLVVALTIGSAYRSALDALRRRTLGGRFDAFVSAAKMLAALAFLIALAYAIAYVCLPQSAPESWSFGVDTLRPLLCLYAAHTLIALLGFFPLSLWHRRRWGVHEMTRLLPSVNRLRAMAATSALSIALLAITPLCCWTPPHDVAWALLAPMALPSLWMTVLAMPRYFIGLDAARSKLAQLQRRPETIRDAGSVVSSLRSVLPETEFRDLGQSTAALLQNELKDLLDDLGFAFERVMLLVDDVDVLPSLHYNDLMRIFRAATKAERVSVVMSVPTVFWHAYCGPRRTDIHSSVRDFWLLGSNRLYVLASQWNHARHPITRAVPLFDTVIADPSERTTSLILGSQVLLAPAETKDGPLDTKVRDWLSGLLMARSLIPLESPPPDPDTSKAYDPAPQCLGWLLDHVARKWTFRSRGRPAPDEVPLQALVVAFGNSIREWLRFVERAIQRGGLGGWETMRPIAHHSVTSTGRLASGHRIRLAETDKEWELCFATVLERDCLSEHMLDHDRHSKCNSGRCTCSDHPVAGGGASKVKRRQPTRKQARKRAPRKAPTPAGAAEPT
jgi:hypothetical protein